MRCCSRLQNSCCPPSQSRSRGSCVTWPSRPSGLLDARGKRCGQSTVDWRIAQLEERGLYTAEVGGSTPPPPTKYVWSIPGTQVTVHSRDMGNTFGPNGLSI